MDAAPLCKLCEIERVKSRIDSGTRKGEWRDYCSRECSCAAARLKQSNRIVGANEQALRAANLQRSRDARRAELQQVFGDRLRRDGLISVAEAVELALRYGQKRYHAGYQAGYERASSVQRMDVKQAQAGSAAA
jgi:hypothetical protein